VTDLSDEILTLAQHAGQTTLPLMSQHAESRSIHKFLRDLTGFFLHLRKAAVQLTWTS
jgi:hypothetical protein